MFFLSPVCSQSLNFVLYPSLLQVAQSPASVRWPTSVVNRAERVMTYLPSLCSVWDAGMLFKAPKFSQTLTEKLTSSKKPDSYPAAEQHGTIAANQS